MLFVAVVSLAISVATIVSYLLGPHDGSEEGPRFGDGDNLFMPVLSGVASLLACVFELARPGSIERALCGGAFLVVILGTLFMGELWLFFAEKPLRRLYVSVLGDRRIEWNYRKIRYGIFAACAAWYVIYLLILR